ncbi:UNVERIFIED_CONTAM: hypothetical protein Slati_2487800 [Sesamum latifolium]|uniref:Uncharacterized protein n=1 Tax=Sesamum latifolium TaxID=2727402 RepID=A0AAW2WF49_9LAMI
MQERGQPGSLWSEIISLHQHLEQAVLKLQDYPSSEKGKKKLEELWSSQVADFKKSVKFQCLLLGIVLKYYYHGY